MAFSSVQSLSRVQFFATPWTAARQASLSITNSRSVLKLMSIESVMPCNQLIVCHPLLLVPSIFPSTRVFSTESFLCIRWPKYWSFSISPSSEYSGLISLRIDWFDLLGVQGTLRSLLQYYSSNASAFAPCFLYGSPLTSIHDYWKNHSFDWTGKNTGVGCYALLQGIFPTQGSNPGLLHCWWILYHLGHQGSWAAWGAFAF